jgi:hypothetical protein
MMMRGRSISDSKRRTRWRRRQRCYHNRVTDFHGRFIHYIDFVLAKGDGYGNPTPLLCTLFAATRRLRVYTNTLSERGAKKKKIKRIKKSFPTAKDYVTRFVAGGGSTCTRARAYREIRRSVPVTRVGPVAGAGTWKGKGTRRKKKKNRPLPDSNIVYYVNECGRGKNARTTCPGVNDAEITAYVVIIFVTVATIVVCAYVDRYADDDNGSVNLLDG